MPTGAIIVICAGLLFGLSLLFAPRRGVLASVYRRWRLARTIGHQNLLRALAECEEGSGQEAAIPFEGLLRRRSWSPGSVRRLVKWAGRQGFLTAGASARLHLTPAGRAESRRILRNYRLWEMYLIKYADIAPSHVDRDADEIEHVLSNGIISELERALAQEVRIPPPHGPEVIA